MWITSIINNEIFRMVKIKKIKHRFHCGWCNKWFKQDIGKQRGHGNKGNATDQAVCPGCNNNVSQKLH